jgi:hypothetical protein
MKFSVVCLVFTLVVLVHTTAAMVVNIEDLKYTNNDVDIISDNMPRNNAPMSIILSAPNRYVCKPGYFFRNGLCRSRLIYNFLGKFE